MSNHFSAANLRFPGSDRRLDLTDVFVFASSQDPDNTVLPARAGRRGARRVDPGQLRRHGPARAGSWVQPDPAVRRPRSS